jgi:hypothetical protein
MEMLALGPAIAGMLTLGSSLVRFKPASHRNQLADVKGCRHLLQVTLKAWPLDRSSSTDIVNCQTLFISQTECRPFCQHPER